MRMEFSRKVILLKEPKLCFGYDQQTEFTKDGLTLFGPLDSDQNPPPMRVGVIASQLGLKLYKNWVKSINGYLPPQNTTREHHVGFPGFEAVFGVRWPENPASQIIISNQEILDTIHIQDTHQAIYKTVSLYEGKIRAHRQEEEQSVDLWFIVIPEEVYKFGRPNSKVPRTLAKDSPIQMTEAMADRLENQFSLWEEDHENAEIYKYEKNFHNQLKARLLDTQEVIQVVRETTLAPQEFTNAGGRPIRQVQDPATLAWNLCVASYFKSSGRPWRLADVRKGVCYVGLVFKQDVTDRDPRNACCGAQMFLDSGDGLVFKGAVGPWYVEETGQYHLSYEKAKSLAEMIVDAYKKRHGYAPGELFIHGKTFIDQYEWQGFCDGVPEETNVVCIRIQDEKLFKLYDASSRAAPRGTAFLLSPRRGYLWTKGFIPRLQTYPGWEVPKPLSIEITHGNCDLELVLNDIMGLTKVNFNACLYADGDPVTLRFADRVGEILTAIPDAAKVPPLPFKHYI